MLGLMQVAESKVHRYGSAAVCWLLLGWFTTPVFAWGPEGHAVIGVLAVERLQPQTRLQLEGIVGTLDEQTIFDACNWPDEVRKTAEWEWTSPFHYVNIPQGEYPYSRPRDCPTGQCVTEALKNYAFVLGQKSAYLEVRQQAFNWVCHLTGDLHQPLHTGYASDRGGNDFEVRFEQETMNLHAYWDFALIRSHFNTREELQAHMGAFPNPQANMSWTPVLVEQWTNESHQLVEEAFYPANPVIDKSYQETSWAIMQQQLNTAASRMAAIIESVLSPNAAAE